MGYYEELEDALQKALDDSFVLNGPSGACIIGKFEPGTGAKGKPSKPVQIEISNPDWWKDWMYEK